MTTNLLGYVKVSDLNVLENIQNCLVGIAECNEHFDNDENLEVWVEVSSKAVEALVEAGFLTHEQEADIEKFGVETILFYS